MLPGTPLNREFLGTMNERWFGTGWEGGDAPCQRGETWRRLGGNRAER
jgi:hypothetical protein